LVYWGLFNWLWAFVKPLTLVVGFVYLTLGFYWFIGGYVYY